MRKKIIKERWFAARTKATESGMNFLQGSPGRGERSVYTNTQSRACGALVSSEGPAGPGWRDSEQVFVSVERPIPPWALPGHPCCPHSCSSQSTLCSLPDPEPLEPSLRQAGLWHINFPWLPAGASPEDTHGNSWCQTRCLHVHGETLPLRLPSAPPGMGQRKQRLVSLMTGP